MHLHNSISLTLQQTALIAALRNGLITAMNEDNFDQQPITPLVEVSVFFQQ